MLFIIFHYSFYWTSTIFSFVAMASAKAEQVTKEKPSFATKTTLHACRSLSKNPL